MRRAVGLSVAARPILVREFIRGEGRAVISSRTKYPRLGMGFGGLKRWDRGRLRLR